MVCKSCGAPVEEDRENCDSCRWGHLVRKRDDILARRATVAALRTRQKPRKPAHQAARREGTTTVYCRHRHRTKEAAMGCPGFFATGTKAWPRDVVD